MITFLRRKMRIFIYFIVGAFVLSLVAGSISLYYFSKADVRKSKSASRGGLDPDASEETADSGEFSVNSTAVAARIHLDGRIAEITEGELNQKLRESEFFKRSGGKIPPEFAKFLYPQELERMVKQKLLSLKADTLPVDVSAEVNKTLQNFYNRMGGREKVEKDPRFDLAELSKSIESSLKYQKLVQSVIGGRVIDETLSRQAYDVDKESRYKNEDGTYKPFEAVKGEIEKQLRTVVTEKDIEAYYNKHKNRWKLPSKATFRRLMIDVASDEALAAVSFSDDQLKTFYEANSSNYRGQKHYTLRHIFIDPSSKEYAGSITVSDEEIQARYEENIDDYREEAKVKTSSILFKAIGDDDSEAVIKARAAADKAFQRILTGEDFDKVMKDVSEDPLKDEDEGYWARGLKDQATEDTVFSLSTGGLSKPVKTDRGIEIFKLIDKKESFVQPLDKVRSEVEEQIRTEKSDKKALDLLTDLLAKIRSRETDFEKAAAAHSQAPSATFERPGLIGNVVLGKNDDNSNVNEIGKDLYIDYSIRNLLKDDAIGVFDPIRSAKGYHLVELLKVVPAGILPLEKCREKVEKDYRSYLADKNGLTEANRIRTMIDKNEITFEEAVEKFSTGSDKASGGLWKEILLSEGQKPKSDGKDLDEKILEESGSNYGLSNKIIAAIKETPEGAVSRPVKLAKSYQLFKVEKKFADEFEPMSDEIKDEIKFALNPTVPVDEIKTYFEENQDKYRQKAKLIIQHVMVSDENQAKEILEKAKAGEDFDKLVKAYSIDYASRKRGGTLVQESTPKQIEEAIKNVKEGEIAPEVINSGVGYHVLKLVKREDAKEPVFEEAKDSIEEELLRPKVNGLLEEYVSELRNAAVVEMWDGPENPLPRSFSVETGLSLSSPDLKVENGADKASESEK